MVVGFTTTYAISVYHLESCEFESRSWQCVLDTTLCDEVCQWLSTGQWFSLGPLVSSTNKTDCHNIAEILLKVALNTITPNQCIYIFICNLCVFSFISLKDIFGINRLTDTENCPSVCHQTHYDVTHINNNVGRL